MTNKKMLMVLAAIASTFIFALPAYAGKVCFKNKAEWEAVKDQLPPMLQTTPLRLVSDSMKVTGGIQASFEGKKGAIKLSAIYMTLTGTYDKTSDYVSGVCVNGNNVSFAGKNEYKVALTETGAYISINGRGADFRVGSKAEYAAATKDATDLKVKADKKLAQGTGNK